MDTALLYTASTWILPLVLAITLHEAAHAWAAHKLGDPTAFRLGRVSFNPVRHIDPFGTLLMPALLLLGQAPFVFGYAKPVPVNFGALRNPRYDSVKVALAGPATNLLLALLAGLLVHGLPLLPPLPAAWVGQNLVHMLTLNVMLAVFNMLPLPPLDGGRVMVGLLPFPLARRLAAVEPYGMMILLVLLLALPVVAHVNVLGALLQTPVAALLRGILWMTGTL